MIIFYINTVKATEAAHKMYIFEYIVKQKHILGILNKHILIYLNLLHGFFRLQSIDG